MKNSGIERHRIINTHQDSLSVPPPEQIVDMNIVWGNLIINENGLPSDFWSNPSNYTVTTRSITHTNASFSFQRTQKK